MASARHDLIVIGAGPGGYPAALRAAQLGLDAACIERAPVLGGTCLRVGCIPSKALLEASHRYYEARHGKTLAAMGVRVGGVELDLGAMMAHKDATVQALTRGVEHLLRKNGVTRYQGTATFVGARALRVTGEGGEPVAELEAEHVIIATGSRPATLRGVELDGDRIVTSTEALSFAEVPRRLVVIGAGVIGLELGSVWARLGAEVTILEYLDRILPGADEELCKEAERVFSRQGLRFELGQRVTGARVEEGGCVVEREGADDLRCDRVLVATGRVPNTEALGLGAAGVDVDDRGRISVDETFATSAQGVYAIGDVIRGPMLAHKATEEGIACVERIVTGFCHVDYEAIPSIVYTEPEVAWAGRTERDLEEEGIPYRKGTFPFSANGRARALGDTTGRVKLLCHAETDRLLGAHILGPRAGDVIAELAVAMSFGASGEDVARAVHAHPTLAEAVKEAALAVEGRALHI